MHILATVEGLVEAFADDVERSGYRRRATDWIELTQPEATPEEINYCVALAALALKIYDEYQVVDYFQLGEAEERTSREIAALVFQRAQIKKEHR